MTLSEAATVTKALGHPGRPRILAILRGGPLSVCQIATILSAPASTISGHLFDLRRAGLVCEQRTGKWIHCRLNDDHCVAALLMPLLAALTEDREIQHDTAMAGVLRRQSRAGRVHENHRGLT
jgi:ArsR family transcriptional regulator